MTVPTVTENGLRQSVHFSPCTYRCQAACCALQLGDPISAHAATWAKRTERPKHLFKMLAGRVVWGEHSVRLLLVRYETLTANPLGTLAAI